MELPDEIYDQVVELARNGDDYAEREQFSSALHQYNEALALLPEPKLDWEAATWLYVAIGDAYFNRYELQQALYAYRQALMAPDGTGNAYIWFSIGQVLFEQKEMEQATEHFLRAYMLDGHEVFEDQNPEYFELIRTLTEKENYNPPGDQNRIAPDNSWLPPEWNKN